MPENDAQELSQEEIEALLSQASELSSDTAAESTAGSPGEAPASDVDIFSAVDAAPARLDAIEDVSPRQDHIMAAGEAVEVLGDIPIDISIELGRVKLTIGELIDLRAGSVVDLDRLAGEPVDVLANGAIIARGEVVVVNEYYSVRITDIVDEDE